MVAWAIGGRNQQKKQLYRIAIEALKVDALLADGHRTDQPIDARMLGMGDGNTPTNPGAAKILPLHDRLDDAFHFIGSNFAGIDQRLSHLTDDTLFGCRDNVGANRLDGDKI